MKITIIGAGIGGLTTAISLQQKGFDVCIFEQSQELKPVGAGIILANNAMQVYEKLGLKKAIEAKGTPIRSMNITDAKLSPLSKIDLSYFEKKHKVKTIVIHRGHLQKILLDQLNSIKIHLGHHLHSVRSQKEGYALQFENGTVYTASILIGADGLNSKVRNLLFTDHKIRKANQICWRGITQFELAQNYKQELNEAWGGSERFGFVPVDKNKVYWYALKSFEKDINEFSVNKIASYFSTYHPLIKSLINSTPKTQINTAEIADLKPNSFWYQDKVCLIGDAAHATTPNMGQGACQAIEDAYVLAACLQKFKIDKAFQKYQKIRLPKAHKIVKSSWYLGKIAHLSNPIWIAIRNKIMKTTPDSIQRKQSEQIFKLHEIE